MMMHILVWLFLICILSLGTLSRFEGTLLSLHDRLRTFKGFVCEGERMMCMWAHQKQAVTSQNTFQGFSLKCLGNMKESKEKCWSEYCLLRDCCLLISCSHVQGLTESENEEEEEMWNLSFYKNEICFLPQGEYLVWWLFDATVLQLLELVKD